MSSLQPPHAAVPDSMDLSAAVTTHQHHHQAYHFITTLIDPYTLLALFFFFFADTIYAILLYRSCRVVWRINRPEFFNRCLHAGLLGFSCYASSAFYVVCWLIVLEGGGGSTPINQSQPASSPPPPQIVPYLPHAGSPPTAPALADDTHSYDVRRYAASQAHSQSTPFHPSHSAILLLIPSWICYFVIHQAANRFARSARRDLVEEEYWVWGGGVGGRGFACEDEDEDEEKRCGRLTTMLDEDSHEKVNEKNCASVSAKRKARFGLWRSLSDGVVTVRGSRDQGEGAVEEKRRMLVMQQIGWGGRSAGMGGSVLGKIHL